MSMASYSVLLTLELISDRERLARSVVPGYAEASSYHNPLSKIRDKNRDNPTLM